MLRNNDIHRDSHYGSYLMNLIRILTHSFLVCFFILRGRTSTFILKYPPTLGNHTNIKTTQLVSHHTNA